MRWTMHFKLNPDLSMLLYLALSIKLLKDCESRSSLLVSSPGEGKAKQSEAKQVHSSPKRRRDTGDTGDTRDINASVPCPIRQVSLHVDAMSTVRVRVKTLERERRKLRPDEDRVHLTRAKLARVDGTEANQSSQNPE